MCSGRTPNRISYSDPNRKPKFAKHLSLSFPLTVSLSVHISYFFLSLSSSIFFFLSLSVSLSLSLPLYVFLYIFLSNFPPVYCIYKNIYPCLFTDKYDRTNHQLSVKVTNLIFFQSFQKWSVAIIEMLPRSVSILNI